MKMSDAFPSMYLKAADFPTETRLIMAHVQSETLGQGDNQDVKPVLYFKDQEKGLVLNKTNANTIADQYGDDSEAWRGEPLILFKIMTNDPNGKVVPAIRCRVPTAKDNKAAAPHRPDPISSGLDDFPGDRNRI
jgi:hypothetical protein